MYCDEYKKCIDFLVIKQLFFAVFVELCFQHHCNIFLSFWCFGIIATYSNIFMCMWANLSLTKSLMLH